MYAASPSTPSPAIDALSNDALLEHLTPVQQRNLETEFFQYLKEMDLIGEVKKHAKSTALDRAVNISCFVCVILEQVEQRFVERLRSEGMIQLPQENPEEYEFDQRFPLEQK